MPSFKSSLLILVFTLILAGCGNSPNSPDSSPSGDSVPIEAASDEASSENTEEGAVAERTIKDPKEIASTMFPSTVLIVMNDQNHQPVSLGSGFVVAPGMVVTNHHVIESSASGSVKIIGQEQDFKINGLLAVDPVRDLALLDVPGLDAPSVTISDAKVAVGAKIYPIGNPLGLEGTLSEGLVSGVRAVGEDEIIQISAPISPGSSGGPVLNEYAELVGVAVATIQGGQNLNFAIPSQYVTDLIAKKSELQPLSADIETAKSMLDVMGSQKPTDGIIGENLIWSGQTEYSGDFTYSIRNTTSDMIDNVQVLVIFYDKKNNPLDVFNETYSTTSMYDATIPPGLAKRVHGFVDSSVKKLTTGPSKDNEYLYSMEPSTKVEIRVLSYDIVR